MGRKTKSEDLKVEEANVLPVMNIMFLLIPALLLAMEVASMAAITVMPPKFAAAPSKEPPDPKKPEKALKLKVFVMEDGFRISAGDQQEGAEAGKATDSNAPTLPLKRDADGCQEEEKTWFGTERSGCYDFAQLEAKAKEYKTNFPNETVVTISAENTIPMQIIINTMDSLRGTECKLMDTEEIPPECYFFNTIMEAGAG
jgi:biopolymer transport protein ExbD